MLATSRPLSDIRQRELFKPLGIGMSDLSFSAVDTISPALEREFRQALLAYQAKRRLYSESSDNVNFMGETLFKTIIDFPDAISRGIYTAEVYLFNNGELSGMQVVPIEVTKSGFDAWVYDLSLEFPVLYGCAGICMALLLGWGAGAIFRKI